MSYHQPLFPKGLLGKVAKEKSDFLPSQVVREMRGKEAKGLCPIQQASPIV